MPAESGPGAPLGCEASSIRTFIGAEDFAKSRRFYQALGFVESRIAENMSYFRIAADLGFYLQDYFVKPWCHNSMVFVEVDDVRACYEKLSRLDLDAFAPARLSPIVNRDWGAECFVHDPAGVLWHFGQFND